MGIGKLAAGGFGIVVLIIIVLALGAALGGLVGAGIAAAYNILFGVGFPVWDAAVIGSIVGVAGGGASASN